MPLILEDKSTETHVLRSVTQIAFPSELKVELGAAARLGASVELLHENLRDLRVAARLPSLAQACSRDQTREIRQAIFEALVESYVLRGSSRIDLLMDDQDIITRAKGQLLHWDASNLIERYLRELIEIEGGPCAILPRVTATEIRLALSQLLTDVGLYDPIS